MFLKKLICIISCLFVIFSSLVFSFADEVDGTTENPLTTTSSASTSTSTDTAQTIIIQNSSSSETVYSYSYSRASHTNIPLSLDTVLGSYSPLIATDNAGNVSVVEGISGVDFAWVGGFILICLVVYSFFRLLGIIFGGGRR